MDFVHGFLEEPETTQVREHVSDCAACRKALLRIEEEEELFRAAALQFDRLQLKPSGSPTGRGTAPAGSAGTRARLEFQTGRIIAMAASILLCAGVSWMLLHSPTAGPADGSAQARQEIEKLGSEKQAEREAAFLKLKELGKGAEAELRKALSSRKPEVAAKAKELLDRLVLADELPAGLRRALPGVEDRLAGGLDREWTQEFLKATELTKEGGPKNLALRKEDLSALVGRAFRGAQNPKEETAVADRTEQWGLRLTQFVPAEEAIQRLHGWVDVENMLLQEVLGEILTKHGVSFLIDGTAEKEGHQGRISMKAFDMPAASNLSLLLLPRRMDFTTLEGLVVITKTGQPWKQNGRNVVLPTPEEAKRVELGLKDLVSLDAAKETKAYDDLVTVGPAALGPLMGALRHLEGKAAEGVRRVCRKIAWDNNNLWLVDLPSGADLQKLSGAQRALLGSRISCDGGGRELEDLLKTLGLKCRMNAKPKEAVSASVKSESLSSFLKAVTRPDNLDFYLEGETIVIDTEDNVCAVVER